MLTRREMLARIQRAAAAGVPITNYGVCISALHGVLGRVLEPFPDAWQSAFTPTRGEDSHVKPTRDNRIVATV